MTRGFDRRKFVLTLLLPILLVAGTVFSATIDPLLKGMAWDKATNTGSRLVYENFLDVDSSLNPQDPMVGVILHLEGYAADLSGVPGLTVVAETGSFVTARLPLSSMPWLEADESIAHVEAARMLFPLMELARADGRVGEVWAGEPAYHGAGILVGVIDSGIDWQHEDFETTGNDTRIKYIWDQFGTGTPPTGFTEGVEYDEADINAGNVAQEDLRGHGTHVTGIAAGNGRASGGLYSGVAPEADIIFVKAFDDAQGGFPETNTIAAMQYLADKAAELDQPMVINMSLGGHVGAHDGTSAQEQLIDELANEGIIFCVAAGNEGEEYRHDSGPASGTDLILNIPAFANTSNNVVLVDIWVDGPSWPSVAVTYDGVTTGPAVSGTRVDDATDHGTIVLDNGTGGSYPNGSRRVLIQIDDQNFIEPGTGGWTITLAGGSGTAHAWVGFSTMPVNFPHSDQSHSVAMPGTAEAAITVAAHKTRQSWLSLDGNTYTLPQTSPWYLADLGDHAPFSSYGPTRDGREKPDISAPGLSVFAPLSGGISPLPGDPFLDTTGRYLVSQGTSMASPFISGVVALMLEKNSTMTPAQIKAALLTSADTDEYTGEGWSPAFGAGKVDAAAAVQSIPSLGPPPTGDVNGDELTTVQDLVVLVNHIVDPVGHPLELEARIQGDVYPAISGDGLLNASDLARIVSFVLERDEPGYSKGLVQFGTGKAQFRGGYWWQSVTIHGSGIAAGQFALNLEGALWHPEELVCDEDVQVVAGVTGSQLRVLLYDLGDGFPADGVTVQVPFEIADNQPGDAHTAGVLMVDATGAPLTVKENPAPVLGFLKVAPNPAPSDMRVSFARNGGQSYDLAVYNLRGQRVRSILGGLGAEGPGNVVFDSRDDAGRLLPAGVYFVRLSSADGVLTQKVVLTR
jgi:subtilisin family serine protease